jgi:hypothetical protein
MLQIEVLNVKSIRIISCLDLTGSGVCEYYIFCLR